MGLDMNRVTLKSVLKKSKKMPMGGATTGKGESLTDAGTQTSKSQLGASGIDISKRVDQASGTKMKYQRIVGNMGKLDSSSGIAPKSRSTNGESGIGAGYGKKY